MPFIKKLLPEINQALEENKIELPINNQKPCISHIKSGRDLICVGNEGSGKTTTMVISVIQQLKKAINDVPRALIIVKDKDTLDATKKLFDNLAIHTDLRIYHVIGGTKLEKIRDKIYFGSDIVIGTPDSLNELYSFSGLNLNDLKILVLDDADEVLRRDAIAKVDRLSETISKVQRLLFCSETTDSIWRFAEEYMLIEEPFEMENETEE